jgi:hypothetical protein
LNVGRCQVDGADAGVDDVDVPEPFDESELELSLLVSDLVSLVVDGALSDEPPSGFLAAPLGDE